MTRVGPAQAIYDTGGIMEVTCNLAVEALQHVSSLAASDASKQQLVEACELACGGSCPSAAEQDRVHLILPEK